ncbi:YfcE family phosphodiesterase [Bacillus sp. MUM 116]|uniref:metallophosphoesterase family protein n=1 Tax=Bacillus sp. MUM 116 TaxID=1678002 RepID=UPI0008F5940F|nr:metallophosphoesterase family protein [Bacillus sp. MUM 116]OIK08613.1 YfcE family phosphodiesterase [Bacillus sp. MUM 116]
MDKKIAIFSDIHGNVSALQAVLDDIDRDPQIEHIFCLGDLIGIGYETNEVLDLLRSRKDISYVMGNHDEAILDVIAGRDIYSSGAEREHHKWLAARLDPKFISFMQRIPTSYQTNYNEKELLCVHYHLQEPKKFLTVDKEPTEQKLDELYHSSTADIVCFGHHHVIHHFKTKNRLYLNPGALGCNHKPYAPYAILIIAENGATNVSFREVPYDNETFLLGYKKYNVPDADYILKVFHGNQHLNL